MATKFTGDKSSADSFNDGTGVFKGDKARPENSSFSNINIAIENGRVNVAFQNNINPIQNTKKPDAGIDIPEKHLPYDNRSPIAEQHKKSAYKPIMNEAVSGRKSDMSAPVAPNTVTHYNTVRNVEVHEINIDANSKDKAFVEKKGQQFVENGTAKWKVSRETFNEIKGNGRNYNKIETKEVKTKLEQSSNQAGGIKFETTYKGNKIKGTQAVLAKGKNRTDKNGFINKSYDFIDKVDSTAELLRKEDGDLDDQVDAKAIVLLNHSVKRHRENQTRYKSADKTLKKDIKSLKKEIKAEQKAKEQAGIDGKFANPEGKFVEDNRMGFSDATEEKLFVKNKHNGELFVAVKSEDKKINTGVDRSKGGMETSVSDILDNKEIGTGKKEDTSAIDTSMFVDSKDDAQIDFSNMTNKEKYELRRSQRKAARKAKRKETRKIATRTAVAKSLELKKAAKSDLNGEYTGDAMKDGQGALMSVILSTIKNFFANKVRNIAKKIGMWIIRLCLSIFSFLISCFMPIITMIVPVACAFAIFFFFFHNYNSDTGATSFDIGSVSGDGLLYSSLDDTDIENILSGVLSANPDVTDEQLATLAYALSKVGCEYDQAYHGNTDVDIFDCSSLVYRAYQEAGVDISNSGIYTAAEECRALMSSGNTVTGDLQPGDLIFYGGSDNGRYLGIYHVAIYVGNVDGVDKMVEARDTDSGVVYCDLRGSNVVNVSRPTA
jgi:hypothetical protein